jgi:hypothetical protein
MQCGLPSETHVTDERGRDVGCSEDRLAHVDPHAPHPLALDLEVQTKNAPARFDRERRLPDQAVVVDVFGDATNAVAAHFRFRAVGVEHPHPGVGRLGRENQDQAVAADAEVTVGDGPRQRGGIGRNRLVETADVDVVVARPVHLGESHPNTAPRKSRKKTRGRPTRLRTGEVALQGDSPFSSNENRDSPLAGP